MVSWRRRSSRDTRAKIGHAEAGGKSQAYNAAEDRAYGESNDRRL